MTSDQAPTRTDQASDDAVTTSQGGPGSFTGFTRNHTTPRRVKIADAMSHAIITVGGFGTIVAVLMVAIYLVVVVSHLFESGTVTPQAVHDTATTARPVHVSSDEYRLTMAVITGDGRLVVRRLDNGEVLVDRPLFADGPQPTAWSFPHEQEVIAAGFDDGTMRFGTIGFTMRFMFDVDDEIATLERGDMTTVGDAVIIHTEHGQFRRMEYEVAFDEPTKLGSTSPVRVLAHNPGESRRQVVAVHDDGTLHVAHMRYRSIGDTWRSESTTVEPALDRADLPSHASVTGLGDNAYLIWDDGRLARYSIRDNDDIYVAERLDILDDPAATVRTVGQLIGRKSLAVGDSTGSVQIFVRARPETDPHTKDQVVLVRAHLLKGPAPVTAVSPSTRSRLLAVGYDNGAVQMFNSTNEARIAKADSEEPVWALTITPKEDGVVVISEDHFANWSMNAKDHEVSLGTLVSPIHYEGYPAAQHMWQSTGGDDSFEPKLSFIPLVFGTLKATFYSLLIGVPLALFAAIYTSEFMDRKTRAVVKPTIELMASLPSVVLGFIGGLWIAQKVEGGLITVMTAIFLTPVALFFGAQLWQLLPHKYRLRFRPARLFLMGVFLLLGMVASGWIGPLVERIFFTVTVIDENGETVKRIVDLAKWLSAGTAGLSGGVSYETSAVGGWMFVMVPLTAVAMAFFNGLVIKPHMRLWSSSWGEQTTAVISLAMFATQIVITIGVAWMLSALVGQVADARGSFIGSYDQRNALVVGFVMGFAIIPIIYTIAEDALSTVPHSLRSASLGAGATPWQTAVRIVIPTAMSGLFSAIMIGLGRAVGETMIVLMATGNTPVLEWNVFNGFRTLSANIAVELPEAVRDSSHYRLLFLSGLVLFAMTFILNTAAEFVRLRFRKKAIQL